VLLNLQPLGWTARVWSDEAVGLLPRCRWLTRVNRGAAAARAIKTAVALVWVNLSRRDATSNPPERFFASGEEKTYLTLPTGYGYPVTSSDSDDQQRVVGFMGLTVSGRC
jgi:hypothetical protein